MARHRTMPASLQLCMNVSRLRSKGLTVAAIARELRVTVDEVEEAHRQLLLPTVDDILEDRAMRAAIAQPSEEQRQAARDRAPKKMAERIRRAEIKGKTA